MLLIPIATEQRAEADATPGAEPTGEAGARAAGGSSAAPPFLFRRAGVVAPGSDSAWIDFAATAASRVFDHVVVVVPSIDASGKQVSELLSRKMRDIDAITGPRVLVLLPVVPPPGVEIGALDWATRVGEAGRALYTSSVRAARRADPFTLLERIRASLREQGLPVRSETFLLYLDFDAGDTPGQLVVHGRAVGLGSTLDEALLDTLATKWRDAAEALRNAPPKVGAFANEVHGGVIPTSLAWRVLFAQLAGPAESVKKWLELFNVFVK